MENPGLVTRLADLSKPDLKLVVAAGEVPVGQYTVEMLENAKRNGAGFKDAVLRNIVSYEQDVKGVLAKVVLGEADAGVVYESDITREARQKVLRVEVPDSVNVLASYPIAVVKDSRNIELARKFMDYVRSPAAQKVLVEHGFTSTTGASSGEAPSEGPVEIVGLVKTPLSFGTLDLLKMQQERPSGAGVRDGVQVMALLERAGLQPRATKVTLIGGDGYRKEISLQELRQDPEAIIQSGAGVECVIPSKGTGFKVKGLVRIEVS
jgi:molybdate transport system substrate-binding protein